MICARMPRSIVFQWCNDVQNSTIQTEREIERVMISSSWSTAGQRGLIPKGFLCGHARKGEIHWWIPRVCEWMPVAVFYHLVWWQQHYFGVARTIVHSPGYRQNFSISNNTFFVWIYLLIEFRVIGGCTKKRMYSANTRNLTRGSFLLIFLASRHR